MNLPFLVLLATVELVNPFWVSVCGLVGCI